MKKQAGVRRFPAKFLGEAVRQQMGEALCELRARQAVVLDKEPLNEGLVELSPDFADVRR